jgi:hypothetical protein
LTEITTLYFPVQLASQDQSQVAISVERFVTNIEKDKEARNASVGGWVDEEIEIPGSEGKGRAYVLLTGWQTQVDSKEFKKTHAYNDQVSRLEEGGRLKRLETRHFTLTEVRKDSEKSEG